MSTYQQSYPDRDLVNVAELGVAEQSSYSVWSREWGANGVLRRDCPEDFGFHTDEEDAPWWMVDLHRPYPLETVVLHNRRDGFTDKAKTLSVKVSLDGHSWTTIHAGVVYFGPGNGAPPMVLPLRGNLWARYLRLELNEKNYFHLSKVEIFVESKFVKVAQLASKWNVILPLMGEPNSVYPECYEIIESDSTSESSSEIVGLKINQNGAFGNSVIQYANAIEIARTAGIKFVQVSAGGLVELNAPLEIAGLTFLPADFDFPTGGSLLKGYFFHAQAPGSSGAVDRHNTIKNIVKRLFPSISSSQKSRRELSIHIRAGDIFSTWVHADYVQPPLSFYILLIEKLFSEGHMDAVKLVFEDRRNPVVDSLEHYLRDQNIPYSCQSGTVVEDINSLINSKHLAFGYGTFGPAVCHFSDEIETVFNFVPEGGQNFPLLPNVRRIYNVIDAEREYMRIGSWRNTSEQRALMVNYPIQNLRILEEM